MTAPEQMLKPCPNPWCKGTMPPIKVTEVDADGRNVGLKVMCFYDCNLSGPVCATESEAITAWNTRPAPAELVEALDDLQQAEAEYRLMHDRHGDGSRAAGRAWDLMRRAGDKARTALRNAGAAS